ncbi:MAG: HAD-IA family hydrolase [Thermodesulfobacteriota bacterium]|nr:HAD-IA family hydrolase [Thermodesulfobacteriota bacterium]
MRKIDLMVFDFDGTLVYSGDDLANSINHTLKKLGMPVLERKTIIGFVGDGVAKLIERSLGVGYHDRFDEAMEIFKVYYAEHLLDTTGLYPGVPDMLEHFKDRKKLIVTNKLYSYTLIIMEELGITGYFEDIIGLDSNPCRKPDPGLLIPLLEKYGAEKTETVVIGDGVNDILLAKNTGTLSCALLNGLEDRDRLLSLDPDYHCEDISELKELFE